MNYSQAIDFLFSALPMFSRVGAAAYKADLTNTLALCQQMNHPEKNLTCIHIAGTNGKGSCSHMLAAIFQQASYKTGLYTSPHIRDFRERIRVNGQMIPEEEVAKIVSDMKMKAEHIPASFFEFTVVMAFHYFRQEETDIAIIETGLGGLLDSTNVIRPELSVITNISLDHTNFLGHTITEIARQKAGIIKKGIPVVIGEKSEESSPVFISKAREMNSPLFFAEELFTCTSAEIKLSGIEASFREEQSAHELNICTSLPGAYQIQNIRTVLSAVHLMKEKGWQLHDSHIQSGIEHVQALTELRGRMEILHKQPLVIADVSHNEAGIRTLFRQIEQTRHEKLHVVCGFVNDKDLHLVLDLFPTSASYYFTQANIPRAMPANELATLAGSFGLQGSSYSKIADALKNALTKATPNDIILITGSFFILDEVYHFFASSPQ